MRQGGNTVKSLYRSKGFTLIEVLVALLVLSVGVLGVAGMQVTALKNLQSSGSFGVAAMLANDIADRMWVNQAQVLSGSYNHVQPPNSVPDCVGGTCTALELARFDTTDWQRQIRGYTTEAEVSVPAVLPDAAGTVLPVAGVARSYEISVYWDDDHSGSAGRTCPPASADDLDCYQLTVTF
jgi:type IV pilus assembly protein PilV